MPGQGFLFADAGPPMEPDRPVARGQMACPICGSMENTASLCPAGHPHVADFKCHACGHRRWLARSIADSLAFTANAEVKAHVS